MSENENDSSKPFRLSEHADRIIAEREAKSEEEKSLLCDTSFYELENDPELFEQWKAELVKYLDEHPEALKEHEKNESGILSRCLTTQRKDSK